MHQHFAHGVKDEHVRAAVRQALGAHLPPRGDTDGVAFLVDHVHKIISGGHAFPSLCDPRERGGAGGMAVRGSASAATDDG